MVNKTATKKSKKTKPSKKETLREVTIRLDFSEQPNHYYVNYLEVLHSQYEFAITAARLPTRPTDEQMRQAKETGELLVEPFIQLLIPIHVIPGFIKALQSQVEKHEKSTGKKLNETP